MSLLVMQAQTLLLMDAEELSARAEWLRSRLNLTEAELGATVAAGRALHMSIARQECQTLQESVSFPLNQGRFRRMTLPLLF